MTFGHKRNDGVGHGFFSLGRNQIDSVFHGFVPLGREQNTGFVPLGGELNTRFGQDNMNRDESNQFTSTYHTDAK